MKKLLSLILALMMLLTPVLAMGEEYASYTDPNSNYSFSYPAEWTVISKDTFDLLWQIAETQADDTFKATMESVKPQIEQLGMLVMMSEDLTSNINIIRQEVAGATPEALMSISGQLMESLKNTAADLEQTAETVLIDIGNERQAMIMQYAYTVSGMEMNGVQAYVGLGDCMYVFTLTTTGEMLESTAEVLGFVMGSSELK